MHIITWELAKKGLKYAVTPSWIRHLFMFTTTNDIEIQLNMPLFHKCRSNDRTIMESALEYTRQPSLLKSINAVRMALQVVWLSDITTADGNGIDGRCYIAKTRFPRRNNYRWPIRHHLKTKDWTNWRKWITSLTTGNRRTLRLPLGEWQVPSTEWKDTWDCFVSNTG